ncbi:hypothetical protein LTS06_012644, partial [Exophiala xenobiotica]
AKGATNQDNTPSARCCWTSHQAIPRDPPTPSASKRSIPRPSTARLKPNIKHVINSHYAITTMHKSHCRCYPATIRPNQSTTCHRHHHHHTTRLGVPLPGSKRRSSFPALRRKRKVKSTSSSSLKDSSNSRGDGSCTTAKQTRRSALLWRMSNR